MIKILLFVVAVLGSAIVMPLGIIYKVFDTVSLILYQVAIVLDMGVNVTCAEYLNDNFIFNKGYKFGNRKEPVSSVIGKNQRDGTLKGQGLFVAKVLDTIEKDHCIKSIDKMV